MFDETTMDLISRGLQRVFSMKITRSTFREVQNVIFTATKEQNGGADTFLKALLTGEDKDKLATGAALEKLNRILDQYTIPISLSKEVLERGEFLNLLTSELVKNGDNTFFVNRVRRIDGEEFQFITDPSSTLHILQHFINRFHEMKQPGTNGETQLPPDITSKLNILKDTLEGLL